MGPIEDEIVLNPGPSPTERRERNKNGHGMTSGIVRRQKYEWPKTRMAREQRNQSTPAEKLLWCQLRNRRVNGLKFRRQQIIEGFIADFYCEELRLCVEVDGGYHNETEQQKVDAHRRSAFGRLRIETIRFPNQQVMNDTPSVLATIAKYRNRPFPLLRERDKG